MISAKQMKIVLMAVLAVLTLSLVPAQAKKPAAAYTIVPVPRPDGASASHYSVFDSISDVGPAGKVHVVGYHYDAASDSDRAYCWTVAPNGSTVIEDLSAWFWNHDLDVNSAGAICGRANSDNAEERVPAVLLADGTFIFLPADYTTSVRLNNPDESGVFQVVGRYTIWDIASDGTVLATPLVDASGTQLFAFDINDHGVIAGFVHPDNDTTEEQIPAMGWFVDGQLQIATRENPTPDVIIGFNDMQIDNGGNLLGYGLEPSATFGFLPRAVIWPASGGAIDLVQEFRTLSTARANGIATVDGVMQVAGYAYGRQGTFPYLYANGALSDLNGLAEGDEPWELTGVSDINHAGIICGLGVVGKRETYPANCLLIPTNR